VSFAALGTYDVLAARLVAPGRINAAGALLAGASANAISNTLGFHAITASAVRYRVYSRAGFSIGDIARIISLTGLAIGLSYVAALVVALLASVFSGDRLEHVQMFAAGLLLVAALGLLIIWLSRSRRTIEIAQFRLALPSARLTIVQLAIGIVEMAAAVGALYVLMPTDLVPSFPAFSIAVILATVLGVVSHAPGALGVFEAAVVSVVGGSGRADLLAALLLYRLLYNITPSLAAVAALGLTELAGAWKKRAKAP
jgi:uncharacterized membrane protein YbhN (UPF0104 family)